MLIVAAESSVEYKRQRSVGHLKDEHSREESFPRPRASWRSVQAGLRGLKEIPARELFENSRTEHVRATGEWIVFRSPARNSIIVKGQNPGCTLSLEIEGDAIGLHVTRHNYSGLISISIDERHVFNHDLFGTWHPDTPMLLAVEGLGPGRHSFSITIIDAKDGRRGQEIILVSLFMSQASISRCMRAANYPHADAVLSAPPVTGCIALSASQDRNIGDRMSQPSLYFPFLREAPSYDIFAWHPRVNSSFTSRSAFEERLQDCHVVIGGGGLLNTSWFSPALEYVQFAAPRERILWGVGHNSPDKLSWLPEYDSWDVSAADYSLIGVRDYGTRFPWVPCASCMAPDFDKERAIQRELGFFMHAATRDTVELLRADWPGIPMMENFGEFTETIEFLAGCEVVVTNSFHGAYWGILLGRRVVAIPTASKFFSLKHPVPCSDVKEWPSAIADCRSYPEALAECRSSNMAFAARVLERIGNSRARVSNDS